MKHLIKNSYGDRVTIEYIDISDDKMDDFPVVSEIVRNRKTPLPIITFDGEPLWAGALSYPRIVAELNSRGIKVGA